MGSFQDLSPPAMQAAPPPSTLTPFITHPCHDGCTLSLLPVSAYPSGYFICNACARRGDTWNYHCAKCKYDLHVTCASKHTKIRHASHPTCELELLFESRYPYPNSTGFTCSVCRKIESNQWVYRCRKCEFDAHLDCTIVPQQPVLQHQHSAPPFVAALYHNQSMNGQFPVVAPLNPHLQHSASMGAIQSPHRPNLGMMQNNQGSGLGGIMMAAAVQTAVQLVGQAVVHEVIGDNGGGGGDGGGGEDVYSY